MRIFNFARGTGKTTFLIVYSAITKKRIITSSEVMKKYIIEKAKKLNLQVPSPITMYDIFEGRIRGYAEREEYLIDNYEIVSKYIISKVIPAKIDLAFMTADNYEGDKEYDE